jgi:arginase family enzyme
LEAGPLFNVTAGSSIADMGDLGLPNTSLSAIREVLQPRASALLEELHDLSWIGMDLCEVAPAYDHADLTSSAAATLVWTYLCGRIAARPRT